MSSNANIGQVFNLTAGGVLGGNNGTAGDMEKNVYDTQGKQTDIFAYADQVAGAAVTAAQEAKNTADTAETKADASSAAAQVAQTAATSAVTTAQEAKNAADAAKTKADASSAAAQAAQTTASSAVTAAQEAKDAANNALPLAGGTLTGNLRIKGTGNYGTQINLGDDDYVHISEPTDDCLEIKAKKVNFALSNTSDDKFTINGDPLSTAFAGLIGGGGISSLLDITQYYANQKAVAFNLLDQLGSWSDWAIVGVLFDVAKFNNYQDGYDEWCIRFYLGDTEANAETVYLVGNENAPCIVLLFPMYKDNVPLSGVVFSPYNFETFHSTKNFSAFNTIRFGMPPHKADSAYSFDVSRSTIFGIK